MEGGTARLLFDALREDDAAALFAYRADPEVARYQGWRPADRAEAGRFIQAQAAAPAQGPGWFQRALRLRASGGLVGDLGIHLPADARDALEFGISIAPAYQGQGYAGEALQALFAWAFEERERHRLVASVDPRNQPCMALLRSLGMRQEAHHRESLWLHGEWVDDVVFALLAREWRAMPHPRRPRSR